jgi:predicted kinase
VADAPTPTLVVVSGPPGSGKTTLAHALAAAIPCPAVSRDEIKEGMVHAHGGDFEPAPGDPLTQRTFPLFFDVLRLLLEGGASVVAEAAFQDRLWRTGLEPLAGLARLRIVHCDVDAAVAHERVSSRSEARLGVSRHGAGKGGRAAHADASLPDELEEWRRGFASFDRVSIDAPSIVVDTRNGFVPTLPQLVDFVNA